MREARGIVALDRRRYVVRGVAETWPSHMTLGGTPIFSRPFRRVSTPPNLEDSERGHFWPQFRLGLHGGQFVKAAHLPALVVYSDTPRMAYRMHRVYFTAEFFERQHWPRVSERRAGGTGKYGRRRGRVGMRRPVDDRADQEERDGAKRKAPRHG